MERREATHEKGHLLSGLSCAYQIQHISFPSPCLQIKLPVKMLSGKRRLKCPGVKANLVYVLKAPANKDVVVWTKPTSIKRLIYQTRGVQTLAYRASSSIKGHCHCPWGLPALDAVVNPKFESQNHPRGHLLSLAKNADTFARPANNAIPMHWGLARGAD